MQLRKCFALAAVAALGACSTVQTSRVENYSHNEAASGFTYFLPKRQIRFIATRDPASETALTQLKAQREAALKAAVQAFGEADTAYNAAKARYDTAVATNTTSILATLQGAMELANVERALAERNRNEAQTQLDDVLAQIAASVAAGDCRYSAQIELLPAQADPRYRMVARTQHSGFRDDQQTFTISQAGLLTSTNIVATDRTGDILVEAARSAGRLAALNPSMIAQAETRPVDCTSSPRRFERTFDPLEGIHLDNGNIRFPAVDQLNLELGPSPFPFLLQINAAFLRDDPLPNDDQIAWRFDEANTNWNPAGGELFYRTPVPVTFTILEGQVQGTPIRSVVMALPQAGPISSIPMASSAFVKSQDQLTFVDGMLTSWTNDRPSEFAGAVAVPGNIVGGLVGGMVQGFKDTASLDNEEVTAIESELALERARLTREAFLLCIARAQEDDSADPMACIPEE